MNTGDIGFRTAGYVARQLLERGDPYLVFNRFGQSQTIPSRSSKTIKFRRYEALDPTPKVMTEGVTPATSDITKTDYSAVLEQLGDGVEITDVVLDTHEDPILNEFSDVLAEQAAQMVELDTIGKIDGGTNVVYQDGVADRAHVNNKISYNSISLATRKLKNGLAKPHTKVVTSTPDYGTQQISPAYIGVAHPNLEHDLRQIESFVPAEKYGNLSPFPNEIGKIESVRILVSTLVEPWASAGADPSTNDMLSTDGIHTDVYPMFILGRDAYGVVPFKGKNVITPMVVNPKPTQSDPWAQRGYITWKALYTALILNDAWMVRIECGASALS